MSAAVPQGKIYLKPPAASRGQKAQLWVFIGGFEQHRQQYPSYDARLAHAISEEAWIDVIGQIRGYMNEKALFKDSTKLSDPCCCCCPPPFPCCFCYIHIRAKQILDELKEIVLKASQMSHVNMWMEGKKGMLKMKFMVQTVRTLHRRPLISMAMLMAHKHCHAGRLVPRPHQYQQEPKDRPGDDVYSRWVPHWPPAGYALVIEVPMPAETYFPIWCPDVPVPGQAPKQVEMAGETIGAVEKPS